MPEDQFRTAVNALTLLLALVIPSWLGWRGGYRGACVAALLYWVFGIVVYEIRSFDALSSGFTRVIHLWVGLVIGMIAAAIRQRRR